jgi:hypothetical protein
MGRPRQDRVEAVPGQFLPPEVADTIARGDLRTVLHDARNRCGRKARILPIRRLLRDLLGAALLPGLHVLAYDIKRMLSFVGTRSLLVLTPS